MTRQHISDCPSLGTIFGAFLPFPQKEALTGKRLDRTSVKISYIDKDDDARKSVEVILTALEWEDGSGECWNFKGFVPSSKQQVIGFVMPFRKQGWIEFI